MVYFGLDPGKCARNLVGKYTGQHLDVWRTLNTVQNHVTSKDCEYIKCILLDGCPSQLTFEEPSSNKLEFIAQGNSRTFVKNPQLVRKAMNKEDRYSYLAPIDQLLCKFYRTFVIPLRVSSVVPTKITFMDTEDEYKYMVSKIHIFKVHTFKLDILYLRITKIHIFK
jgi:hypothetical protein